MKTSKRKERRRLRELKQAPRELSPAFREVLADIGRAIKEAHVVQHGRP